MGCIRLMLPAGLQPLSIAIEGVQEIFWTSESLRYRTGSIVTYSFFFENHTHGLQSKKKKKNHSQILIN